MFARESLEQLLDAIASTAPAPGSGAAAATALAIAIACLRKATAISLHHEPENSSLSEAAARLSVLSGLALDAAERDGRDFSALLTAVHAKDEAGRTHAAEDLVALADLVEGYCARVQAEADGLAAIVRPVMANDVLAARQLSAAAAIIVRANGAENAEQR